MQRTLQFAISATLSATACISSRAEITLQGTATWGAKRAYTIEATPNTAGRKVIANADVSVYLAEQELECKGAGAQMTSNQTPVERSAFTATRADGRFVLPKVAVPRGKTPLHVRICVTPRDAPSVGFGWVWGQDLMPEHANQHLNLSLPTEDRVMQQLRSIVGDGVDGKWGFGGMGKQKSPKSDN